MQCSPSAQTRIEPGKPHSGTRRTSDEEARAMVMATFARASREWGVRGVTMPAGSRAHQIVKWNVLVIRRQSHQPSVWVPPSILAKPRRPGWSDKLGFAIGMITS